jgi:hypothetical protein
MEDRLAYELDEWSAEARTLLDRLLTANDVTHAWEGGTLVVAPVDEEAVDDLVDEVEMATLPTLEPESERVVYEVADWPVRARQALSDVLVAQGIRHEWDGMGDLVVEAEDEARVDAIFDGFEDEEVGEEEDGPEATEVMSALFLAADRLRRSPRDPKATGAALDAVADIVALGPPFGFDRRTWAQVGLRAGELRAALRTDPADDEAIVEAAETVRTLLHPMI